MTSTRTWLDEMVSQNAEPDGLRVSGIHKSFRGGGGAGDAVPVLHGVDLVVPRGGLTAVLGASGGGKTTLLRLVAGFDRPDEGTIAIAGREVAGPWGALAPEERRIGYVTQEGNLFPHLTVAANIAFGLPRRARRARHRVPELLELVGLDNGYAHRYPHQLSGGQQQRVALARALGLLPVAGSMPDGPGTVLVRPEQIALDGPDGAVLARVDGIEFYGHDAVVRLTLEGDVAVTARCPGHRLPAVGDAVRVVVHGTVEMDRG